jgi:hypothetical protein
VKLLRVIQLANACHVAERRKLTVGNLDSLRICVDQVQSNRKTTTCVLGIQTFKSKHQHGTSAVFRLLGLGLCDVKVVHASLKQIRSATRWIMFGRVK